MGDWVVAIEGTPAGTRAALVLALVAALAHATLGALQKGRFDPWLTRGSIDLWASALSVPLILFVVPTPSRELWLLMPGVMLVHLAYKWALAMAYTRGAFTAVYPVVRGTGPIATVLFAGFVFGEFFTSGQWLGVALLSGGTFALAVINICQRHIDPVIVATSLALAVCTGIITAIYTVYDAYAIRLADDPFTFIAWFFFLEAFLFPPLLWRRWRQADPGLVKRGLIGACIAYISFGSVFLATRLDKVGEAAVLRETSVVFAALIGWFFLKEPVGSLRAACMVVIAGGAILVEFG